VNKSCVLYFFNNEVYIIGSAETESGYNLLGKPCSRISLCSADSEIGESVLTILKNTPEKVPNLGRIEADKDPILKFLGFKSWKTQGKNSLRMDVELKDRIIRIVPCERDGKGGYTSEWDSEKRYYPKAKTCQVVPKEIGKLVLEQLKECK